MTKTKICNCCLSTCPLDWVDWPDCIEFTSEFLLETKKKWEISFSCISKINLSETYNYNPMLPSYLSRRAGPAPLCVVFGCSSMALVTLACRCVALLFIIDHLLLLKVLAHKARPPSCSSVILNVWLGAADQILQHPLSFSSSSSFFFSKQQQNQNQ